MMGICVCFLNYRWQVVVQLIWVVVGCGLWAMGGDSGSGGGLWG